MRLTKNQIDILSGYFSDISKILVGSAVIGFFVPSGVGPISIPVFIGGSATAVLCLFISIGLIK